MKRRLVKADMDYAKHAMCVEVTLTQMLKGRKLPLVCDLNPSRADFDALTDTIRREAKGNYTLFRDFSNKYPVCTAVHAVFQNIFGESDDFWPSWGARLGVELNALPLRQREIGDIILGVLDKLGYPIDSEDGRKYIKPIRAQAGMPAYCLVDLFNLIDEEENADFDPMRLAEELATSKSYLVNRPVNRLAHSDYERTVEMLIEIREALQISGSSVEMASHHHYIRECAEAWREESKKNDRGEVGKCRAVVYPRLCYQNDGRALCIYLPSVTPENEFAESLTWKIEIKSQTKTVRCKVRRSGERAVTREKWVPVSPENTYQVTLEDDIHPDCFIKKWDKLPGFERGYMLFSGSGKVSGFETLPSSDSGYLVLSGETEMPEASGLMLQAISTPESMKAGTCYLLSCMDQDSSLNFCINGERITLRQRPAAQLHFVRTETLFHEPMSSNGNQIFTVFPTLEIRSASRGKIYGLSMQCQPSDQSWQIVDLGGAGEADLRSVPPEKIFGQDAMPYGIYTAKVYMESRLAQALQFYYIPQEDWDETYIHPWPERDGTFQPTRFLYACSENMHIQWNNEYDVSHKFKDGRQWDSVFITGGEQMTLSGVFTYQCEDSKFHVPFVKTVRNVIWYYWDEFLNTLSQNRYGRCRLDQSEIEEKRTWLALRFSAAENQRNISLQGIHEKKTVLSIPVSLQANGIFSVKLKQLTEPLTSADYPFALILSFQDASGGNCEICIGEIHETSVLHGLRYLCNAKTQLNPFLVWKKTDQTASNSARLRGISDPDFDETLDLRPARPSKKNESVMGMCLRKVLPDGLYAILPEETSAEDDWFAIKTNDRFLPILPGGENMLEVNPDHLQSNEDTFGLVSAALTCYHRENILSAIADKVEKQNAIAEAKLSRHDIRLLVTLAALVQREERSDDSCGTSYSRILACFGETLLTGEMRAQITLELAKMNLKPEQADFIFRKLNLFLFCANGLLGDMLTEDTLLMIEQHDCLLELLWRLRMMNCNSIATKMVSTIGGEASKQLFSLHQINGCSPLNRPDCINKNLTGICKCMTMQIPTEIAGNHEDFDKMQEWDMGKRKNYPDPVLHLERAPERACMVCGSSYIDLLVKWFRATEKQGKGEVIRRNQKAALQLAPKLLKAASGLSVEWTEKYQVYMRLFSARKGNDQTQNIHFLFWCTAAAAFIEAAYNKCGAPAQAHAAASEFLSAMIGVSSGLVRRDLILAELYVFTKT